MKKLVYSDHALDRLEERYITESEVRTVLENPDITTPTPRKRRKRSMKTINGRTIGIIYEERPNYIYIITCTILCQEA